MKRYFSIFLSVAILFSLFAGLGGVFAADTISITADKTVLVVGQTATLTITVPSGASYSLTCTDDDMNKEVITLDTNGSVPAIIANNFGTAIVTATCTVNGKKLTDTVTIKVRTPTGLISGEDYYAMNLQTGMFLAIPSGGDFNGTPLCGMPRGTNNRAKWTVEIAENGNGVTRLINVSSSTNRAMYITGELDAVLFDSTSTTVRSQIGIHRVESGTYQGKYLMRYNGKFVSMNSSGDIYLASSLNTGSYWTFMAVEKGDADLITFRYTYEDDEYGTLIYDTTDCRVPFNNALSAKGYTVHAYNTNISVLTAYSYLSERDDIFVYRGHGGPGILQFTTTNDQSYGKLYANYCMTVSNASYEQCYIHSDQGQGLSDNALAQLRLVMYLGCNTGNDGISRGQIVNLMNSTFEKGAHFVLGTTQITEGPDSDNFLRGFLTKLNENTSYTIKECIQAGVIRAGTNTEYIISGSNEEGYYPWIAVGDDSQYLD